MEVKSNKRTTQTWNGFAAMLRTRAAIVHFQGTRTMNNRKYYYVIHVLYSSRDFGFYRLQPDVKHPFKLLRPECRNWLWWLADCRSCQWVRIPTPYATIRMMLLEVVGRSNLCLNCQESTSISSLSHQYNWRIRNTPSNWMISLVSCLQCTWPLLLPSFI